MKRDLAPSAMRPECLSEDIANRTIVRVYLSRQPMDRGFGWQADALVGGFRQARGPVAETEAAALLALYPILLRRGASKRWPIRVCDSLGDRVGWFGYRLEAYAEVSDRRG